jgi:hypothetical protein
MIIRKVWKHKATDQMLISIPKNEGIEEGDYVRVVKVKR